jgi:hydroxyacylglutathione hydrolase
MPQLDIHQFFCRSDNYGVLIHDPASGDTAAIDAPESAPIERALADKGWRLTHILMTHHHADHASGVADLKAKWNCAVVGNAADAGRLPALDATVEPGGTYDFAGHRAHIIDTPGHTVGHIAWHFGDDGVLFAGDTLFAMGCGRVFEGTFEQMWSSLARLKALPPTRRCTAATSTPRPTRALRSPWIPTTPRSSSARRKSTSSGRAARRRCRRRSPWNWRPTRSCASTTRRSAAG